MLREDLSFHAVLLVSQASAWGKLQEWGSFRRVQTRPESVAGSGAPWPGSLPVGVLCAAGMAKCEFGEVFRSAPKCRHS